MQLIRPFRIHYSPSLAQFTSPQTVPSTYLSPRLLAIHRTIGRILYLSPAGDDIDRILRDMEGVDTKENRTTEVGRYDSLNLGGWGVSVR